MYKRYLESGIKLCRKSKIRNNAYDVRHTNQQILKTFEKARPQFLKVVLQVN